MSSERSYLQIAESYKGVYEQWEKREIDTGLALGMFQSLTEELQHAQPSKVSVINNVATARMVVIVNKFEKNWRLRDEEETNELIAAKQQRAAQLEAEARRLHPRPAETWCSIL
jgi:hypothetical protein